MILRSVISLVCALLCITSCAVHEWPEPTPADVIVNLDFDTQMPQYKVLNEEGTRASHDGRDYDIRYTIAAYRLLQDGSYAEEPFLLKVFSKDEIEGHFPFQHRRGQLPFLCLDRLRSCRHSERLFLQHNQLPPHQPPRNSRGQQRFPRRLQRQCRPESHPSRQQGNTVHSDRSDAPASCEVRVHHD